MKDDVILRIKENEALEVVKIISVIYLVFLFFLALILNYQETVIQSFLILIFAIIIDTLNSGNMVVTEKGITCKITGFVKYSRIYRLLLKDRVLYIYTRDRTKPYKITFAMTEDIKLIDNTYKFIDSKIKRTTEDYKNVTKCQNS